MALVYPSTHPVVQHKLASLRAAATQPAEFRALVRSLATLLTQEATTDLPLRTVEVATPVGQATGQVLAPRLGVVPILRAGLGMLDGVLDLLPDATVWHLGLMRDERTLRPTEYYSRLPAPGQAEVALVVDPMLATGGSAVRACEVLKAAGVPRIKFLGLIAAPEGVARLTAAMPDVAVHLGAIDQGLNDVGFILPGLGDAGDRQFGTM